jgi:homocysteine S-methyltransferase
MASDIVLLDGATGTQLRDRGVEVPSHITSIWSAKALIANPDAVVEVHRDYIEAGSEVITANNYAVTPPLLKRDGLDDRFEELTGIAVDLALRARDEADPGGRKIRVAGSVPPLETSYRADLVGSDEVILADYRRMVAALAPRVDLLMVETMASAREAVAAVRAASESDVEVWLSWTLMGDRPGELPSGESIGQAFDAVKEHDARISAYLVNCCGANLVAHALPILTGLSDKPVGGYANSANAVPGSAKSETNSFGVAEFEYEALDVDSYAASVSGWLDSGARIVGGCCYTSPAHIAKLRSLIDSRPARGGPA